MKFIKQDCLSKMSETGEWAKWAKRDYFSDYFSDFEDKKLRERVNDSNLEVGNPEVFCKKDVYRNFAKFTGKHLFRKDSDLGVFLWILWNF